MEREDAISTLKKQTQDILAFPRNHPELYGKAISVLAFIDGHKTGDDKFDKAIADIEPSTLKFTNFRARRFVRFLDVVRLFRCSQNTMLRALALSRTPLFKYHISRHDSYLIQYPIPDAFFEELEFRPNLPTLEIVYVRISEMEFQFQTEAICVQAGGMLSVALYQKLVDTESAEERELIDFCTQIFKYKPLTCPLIQNTNVFVLEPVINLTKVVGPEIPERVKLLTAKYLTSAQPLSGGFDRINRAVELSLLPKVAEDLSKEFLSAYEEELTLAIRRKSQKISP